MWAALALRLQKEFVIEPAAALLPGTTEETINKFSGLNVWFCKY